MNKETFYNKCQENGLILNTNQKNQFDQYYHLLYETNKVMNLTAIIEEDEVYEKHFYDSLLFSFELDLNNKTLVDVGSGAGFPGLVIAIAYSLCEVTLVEPLTKRCNFLNKVIDELKLNNVKVINARAEDLSMYRSSFDYATARAVARLNILLELIMPLIKVNGIFVALKGKQGNEEIEEANNALKILNSTIIKTQQINLITDLDNRINIFIKLNKDIDKKYPRNYSKIKNKPL